jgi:hypothetical protein
MSGRRYSLSFFVSATVIALAMGVMVTGLLPQAVAQSNKQEECVVDVVYGERNLQDTVNERNSNGYKVRALAADEGYHLVMCK